GSDVQLGGGDNYVAVPFSHHASIHDGGGNNNISLNTTFSDGLASTNASSASDGKHDNHVVNHTGNTSADLLTVQVGGGRNQIVDYAGNLSIKAGGGFDILALQGQAPAVIVNPGSSFATN